jgi:hypothetical protein
VPERVQSTYSIQFPSLCMFPWPPFLILRSQVLVLSAHGFRHMVRLFYAVRSIARKCAARTPHPEGGFCDPERASDGARMIVASQEVCP